MDIDLEIRKMMRLFSYQHLPEHLQEVSKPFSDLADTMMKHTFSNLQLLFCLQKLVEAKDCAVRARLGSA